MESVNGGTSCGTLQYVSGVLRRRKTRECVPMSSLCYTSMKNIGAVGRCLKPAMLKRMSILNYMYSEM